MQRSKWMILGATLVLALSSVACNKLKSRDQMNQGVQAYKNTHYQDAINHFKQAVELDPTNQNAQLYLATSYFTQWIPGADTPENNRMLSAARAEFEKVLATDPKNETALASMASMAYSQAASGTPEEKEKDLDEARKWNVRRIETDPKNAEAYYSLGVIAWAQAFPAIGTVRAKLGIRAEESGQIKNAKEREDLKDKYGKIIDDGMNYLQKAIDLNPQYDDAMTYLNLLLRKKADIADTPEDAKADIEQAEKWYNKSLDIKKMKAAQPQKQQSS